LPKDSGEVVAKVDGVLIKLVCVAASRNPDIKHNSKEFVVSTLAGLRGSGQVEGLFLGHLHAQSHRQFRRRRNRPAFEYEGEQTWPVSLLS
jgi:hypothetical protein